MISSLLEAGFTLLEQDYSISLNWLGNLVKLIIDGVGNVAIGVIVFTLILKAITTPFDIYQRISMRKQSLIMREMQPELDKLQKQYANDKQTYQLKMNELQKKNGYSLLGACLPMLITLAVIIIAVGAFQSYATYSNLAMYERMAHSYNSAVLSYSADAPDYRLPGDWEEGTRIIDWEWEEGVPTKQGDALITITTKESDNHIVEHTVKVEQEGKYLFYTYTPEETKINREYYIDEGKLFADGKISENSATAAEDYFIGIGAEAAAASFRESDPGFLWIRNVWYPDVSYKHPIEPNHKDFTRSLQGAAIFSDRGSWEGSRTIDQVIDETAYLNLTSKLEDEQKAPNGYFILIILTIGLMVLSQFIAMRSSKEANKYQTVDGQGASQQKMMMVIMPIIYAITGFMWTAAFSIYIAVSSVFGIVITLICNLVLGKVFKKREEEAIRKRYTREVPKWDSKKKK